MINILVTNNTSIIYNNNKITLNNLAVGDYIDCNIDIYCYYVKPSKNIASFLFRTQDIIKNKIYTNSDSIDISAHEKNIQISKLNDLLNNTETDENINIISNKTSDNINNKEKKILSNLLSDTSISDTSIESNTTSSTSKINNSNKSNSNNNQNVIDSFIYETISDSDKIKNIIKKKNNIKKIFFIIYI